MYLADADSTLPNLALMRLASYFRARGVPVRKLIRPGDRRSLWEPIEDVWGSSIFTTSTDERAAIEREWGLVRWGGTGVNVASSLAEVDPSLSAEEWESVPLDYSLYPNFAPSIGFLTRGCRLRCGFCVVPQKEGRPRAVSTVDAVWRGDGHPKHLHLLDNDAFAKPLRDFWRGAVEELNARKFKVCFSQGINLRLVDDEAAAMVARVNYVGNDFAKRILYTAWDNLRDEGIFRAGVERLRAAGVPPHRLRVFMLVGYRKGETWDEVFYRFAELVALGCEPFVMVFDAAARPDLCAFQRWSNRWAFRSIAWPDYARDGTFDTRIAGAARADSDAAWSRVVGRMLSNG